MFVGYIPGSKGWRFYNPETNKVVEASMAVFPSDKPPIPDKPTEACEPSKGYLNQIFNALKLGKFDAEETLMQQDNLINKIEKSLATANPMVPKTYTEAMRAPDTDKWKKACLAELGQMQDMSVWEVCDLPPDQRVTDAKWVFSQKHNGSYKAWYVS